MIFSKKRLSGLFVVFYLTFFSTSFCVDIDELVSISDSKVKINPAPCTYKSTLSGIVDIGINKLLALDIYLKTYTLNKRAITSLPSFNMYHTAYKCNNWTFGFNLFVDKMDKVFFTKNCDVISSYIDLKNSDLLTTIESLIPPNFNIDVPKIASLFENAKVEERRIGILFQMLKTYGNISFELDLPILWQERNFFLTEEEIQNIKSLKIFEDVDLNDYGEHDLEKHLVSDKLGFDDIKIKFGSLAINNENLALKVGLQSTIPTGFALAKGLIGTDFRKNLKRGKVDFLKLFCLITEDKFDELTGIVKNFGLEALHWLSAMLLDTPLGNEGHFGLGFFVEPALKMNEAVTIQSCCSFEYLFPHNEFRFFLSKKNPADFETEKLRKDAESESTAKRDVFFLSEQLTETLFPNHYQTNITPGLIVQANIGAKFELRKWIFELGYDFWMQRKEVLNYFDECMDPTKNLQIERGIKPKAIQNKIFGKLSFNKINKWYDWVLSIKAEEALMTKGIGKDFAIVGTFEINF